MYNNKKCRERELQNCKIDVNDKENHRETDRMSLGAATSDLQE